MRVVEMLYGPPKITISKKYSRNLNRFSKTTKSIISSQKYIRNRYIKYTISVPKKVFN